MNKFNKILLLMFIAGILFSCDNFIDVVPDRRQTVDKAFNLRSQAQKALFTNYSYLPTFAAEGNNPGFFAGDEMWVNPNVTFNALQIAKGDQKIVAPYMDFWGGGNGGSDFYQGIRQCNIFLDNIGRVPDMTETEKQKWIAETKFLKAYFHFYLIRMYGPITLIKKNNPVSSSTGQVARLRSSVNESFAYVIKLLNEVINNPALPDKVNDSQRDLGRITKTIAYAMKAKVLVTAASPLFNGNNDYKGFTNVNGDNLFNTQYDPAKWDSAAAAAKKAIDYAVSTGFKLYHFNSGISNSGISDSTQLKMTIRASVTSGQGTGNNEALWVQATDNAQAGPRRLQEQSLAYGINPANPNNPAALGRFAPPLKIAEMFYTEHGVPIKDDTSWTYSNRFELQKPDSSDRYYQQPGYSTAKLNINREARYYADLAFDGNAWFGQGFYDDNAPNYIQAKSGQRNAQQDPTRYSITGFWSKKLVNYETTVADNGLTWNPTPYNWPIMRLADLYLLYAEAENEVNGPNQEVFTYINDVRERAGIPDVKQAWDNWTNSTKYTTKDGMREIIHRERLIELAFEGQRLWDLRRWKEAATELNKPITGWDIDQETPSAYYRERTIFNQSFSTKDYLWPLSENELKSNKNLTQNPGW